MTLTRAVLLAVLLPLSASAQSELELFELDAELKAETRVASQRAKTVRETPGVVTVINREEILLSGARDLIDVLRLVPGFSFGVDVEGAVGPGFRGNWGHEGKVLLMVDGIEMNENLYSTLQFGNHYPIHNVQRVEVIRGPGSAQYGGYAELAVVNVITRTAKDLQGASASLSYGQYQESFGHQNLGFTVAEEIPNVEGLSASVSGLFGQGQRSDGTYSDFYGTSYSMVNANRTDPAFLNVGASWNDLHLRFLYDNYRLWTRDAFDAALAEPSALTFTTTALDLRYELKASDRVTLTPRLIFRQSVPWKDDTEESDLYYDKSTQRLTARVTLNDQVLDNLNLMVGGEVYLDSAWLNTENPSKLNTAFADSDEVSYSNRALFAEVFFEHWIANLIVGARLEDHSAVGASFVPRVAVTRVWDRFHLKALFSRAFRAPGIENINLSENLRPESTQVLEAELGARIGDYVFVTVNAFDIGIENPIVYFYDEVTEAEGYRNYTRTGTRGAEAEVRFRRKGMWASLGYSFYVANQNEVETYAVEGRDDVLLGMPTHKLSALAGFNVWEGLHVSPSAVFLSERFGYLTGVDGVSEVEAQGPALVLNLFLTYRDLGLKGLNLGVGVHDLLDAAPPFLQPYAGGHAPLPGPGREFRARVTYTYAFE